MRRPHPSTQFLLCVVLLAGCKRNAEEPVEPEDDTWVPDEKTEPVAAVDPAPGLSEEEKEEKAKGLYVEAEGKAKADQWADALNLYEQAYYLVPAKHGFALKVAVAAEKVGDCAKARTYYEHFVKYADPEKYKDDLAEANKHLATLRKKC